MKAQQSKKLNNHQKLIAAISLIVVAFLAICVTFAWYTNRIFVMKGSYTLGSYHYQVALFDVTQNGSGGVSAVTQRGSGTYTRENSVSWEVEGPAENFNNLASGSVRYQVIKVYNQNSGFDIKAYEYLKYDESMTAEQATLANAFYFKPVKLAISDEDDLDNDDIKDFLNENISVLPPPDESSGGIASPETDITFGRMKDNAIALESGSVAQGKYAYYLVGYCVTGLSEIDLNGASITVQPVITIGQANAPIPQSSAETKTREVTNWHEFRVALTNANDGDTVRLTADVESPANTDLSITKAINLDLNSYNLTIHGNVKFNYKTAEQRSLLLTSPSVLKADGNLTIETKGSFNIYSNVTNDNILLGHKDKNDNLIGGRFQVNCGMYVNDGSAAIKPQTVNEDSGLILNNCIVKSIGEGGAYENATLLLTGSDSMIKLAGGSHLEKITHGNIYISNIYIANHGIINEIDFSTYYSFPNETDRQVHLYVKNYNTVNTLKLPGEAKGYNTAGSSAYNTRIIDNNGAATTFKNVTGGTDKFTSIADFKSADVEPFNTEVGSHVVYDADTNTHTIYFAPLPPATGEEEPEEKTVTELFAEAKAEAPAALKSYYEIGSCSNLKLETLGSFALTSEHFDDIRTCFASTLLKVDLSNATLEDRTIADGAFENCALLREVVFPVVSFGIGSDAFKGTAISKITLSSNLNSDIGIGSQAFYVTGNLEVIWNKPSDIPSAYLSAFQSSTTLFFMEKQYAERADTIYDDEWVVDMYEFYDFKANTNTYYCKYTSDGSSANGCEIIYFAGSLSTIAAQQDKNLVPATLNDGSASYNVVAVNNQAFRKAIIADHGASLVDVTLTNCLKVGKSAFRGTEQYHLRIDQLDLGKANRIGQYAFKYNTITYSVPRANNYAGMVSLGSYAFEYSSLSGGVLGLQGPSEKYTPDNFALSNFSFNGQYNSGNAQLNLSNVNVIYGNFALGAQTSIKSDIILNNINSIATGAFTNAIKNNHDGESDPTPTNVVDARNVKSIGAAAFNGIECGTLMLGITNNAYYDSGSPYIGIIGSTGAANIGTVELYNTFPTTTQPALVSATGAVTIGTVHIAKMVDGNDAVVKTTIPQYAFATAATGPSTEDGINLFIDAVSIETGASFDIARDAFRGTGFTSTDPYVFEGVVNIASEAFAYSSIRKLNLGTTISYIEDEDFIKYCDYIRLLVLNNTIPNDAEDLEDYVVTLGGTEAANLNFSSTGGRVGGLTSDQFQIEVDTRILTTYIQQYFDDGATTNVWYGWRTYFKPLVYSYSDSTNSKGTWYYYVIENPVEGNETHATDVMGLHIIDYQYTGSQTLTSANIYIPHEINVPGIGWCNVRELGTDDTDLFRTLPDSLTPRKTGTNKYYSRGVVLYMKGSGSSDGAYTLEKISPYALRSDKIVRIAATKFGNTKFFYDKQSGTLYSRATGTSLYFGDKDAKNEIVKVFDYVFTSSGTSAYRRDEWNIYKPAENNRDVYLIDATVTKIQKGAFENCQHVTEIRATTTSNIYKTSTSLLGAQATMDAKLSYIEAGAFSNSTVRVFNFVQCNNRVNIGENALGDARKMVINDSGYYNYQKADNISIIIPVANLVPSQPAAVANPGDSPPNDDPTSPEYIQWAADKADYDDYVALKAEYDALKARRDAINKSYYTTAPEYYLYQKYGCISTETVTLNYASASSLNKVPGQESNEAANNSKLALQNTQSAVSVGGVRYELMNSGTVFNAKTYASKKSEFIAVVTGLSSQTTESKVVVIPASISVKGITYEVVAMTDDAIGTNTTLETLVLPNREFSFSSTALSGCTNLGIIQYNDVVAYTESTETVASLPVASTQSLIEGRDDEKED